jgi:hypothetical protein
MAQVSHFRFSLFLKTVLKNLAMNNLFLRTKNKKKDTTTVSAQNILKCGFTERFQSQNLVPKTKIVRVPWIKMEMEQVARWA